MSNANEKNEGIRFDEFVSKIVGDPAKPASHTVLKGYIGRSSEEGHLRVYFDEALNKFIDVPESAVIHAKPLSDNPLGGSTIWVKADTEYTYGDPAAEKRAKKKFFDGPIYQDYVANLKTQETNDSISFQYCMSSACTRNCSQSCITFQYCISDFCTRPPVEERQLFNTATRVTAKYNAGSGRFNPGQFNDGDGGSISFQYCPTQDGACPTQSTNCSDLCPSFQYCPSGAGSACNQQQFNTDWYQRFNVGNIAQQSFRNVNQQFNRFNPGNITQAGDSGTISFQYCATQDGACPTQSSNCSDLCPSFQYCPTSGSSACGQQQFVTDWYQRFNVANVAQFSNRNLKQQASKFNFGGATQNADGGSISFQYCATQDSACPTQSSNCSDLCPSFQYCPSGAGGDCPSFSSNCQQQFITDQYQNPVFRNGGLVNNPVFRNGGFANSFNPYRAY